MKRILIYIIVLLGVVNISSCKEDFLALYPENAIVSASFYKTEAHFEQAIVASYERMRTIATYGVFTDEMRSDNAHFTRYSGDRGPYLSTEVIELFLDDETAGSWISGRYNEVYSGISRVNTILDRIDASQLSDSMKRVVIAEAKFLRAFYYFDLVLRWGPVPLMLKEVTASSEAFVGNSTVDEVYTQILADVTDAINNGMPVADRFPQSGRATMGAAKMLRAYVNMSKPTRDYPAAERDLKDITNMNYRLEENFADIYALGNKNMRESIFEAQFKDGPGGQQNTIPWRLIPKCSNNAVLMGFNVANTANISGGWAVPTQEFVDSFEPGDKRLSVTVAVAEGIGKEVIAVESVKDIVGFVPTEGKDYHYFARKYYHPPYGYSLQASDNFPLYRYAETLLLLAECLVEQNKAAEAQPYLDQVRARAGLAPVPATKQSVSDERRHELAFENKRWMDLIRTGQAISVMTAFGNYWKSVDGVILPTAYNVTQERLLYAFPIREMRVNPKLVQNPGYKGYF